MDADVIAKYADIIGEYLTKKISVTTFESKFLTEFKTETAELSSESFQILDTLFADVDAFCAEPSLRDEHDLNEDQLRECCVKALTKLHVLHKSYSGEPRPSGA